MPPKQARGQSRRRGGERGFAPVQRPAQGATLPALSRRKHREQEELPPLQVLECPFLGTADRWCSIHLIINCRPPNVCCKWWPLVGAASPLFLDAVRAGQTLNASSLGFSSVIPATEQKL